MAGTPTITGSTQLAAVIGHPIRHSLSPAIHNAAFAAAGLDWVFCAFDIPPGSGAEAVRAAAALGLRGLSVTMPHKDAAAAAVDELSPVARRIGAVNCVVNRSGHLLGENTDGGGFVDALRIEHGLEPEGWSCGVVGAGGAARAVILALVMAGASEVLVVNRTRSSAEEAVRMAGPPARLGTMAELAGLDLVVNATPVGMAGGDRAGMAPFDPGLICAGQVVADLIVHPLRTALIEVAEQRGAVAVGGLGMLVHQAARAFESWTGQDAPLEAMRIAARAACGDLDG